MSIAAKHMLQCPKCGHAQEGMIWESVNVTHDPELKEKLFASKINAFDCSNCEYKTFINFPLLYHDMNMKFCVQFYPPGVVNDPDFLRQFRQDGTLAHAEVQQMSAYSCEYLARPHIVFSMNEMVRYIDFRDKISSECAS